MTNIEIKKSQVVLLKSLGKNTADIAAKYGVTIKEMNEVLEQFGMTKTRLPKPEPTYYVTAVDDVADVVGLSNNTNDVPTSPAPLEIV